ncbi:Peroxisomal nicotinamide adenine dinucleotide carrier [Nymphaea thermarum]|nr:Peroxisomal nicotinamide adenine dinucleotide carrier [Nymphaea thermarum]
MDECSTAAVDEMDPYSYGPPRGLSLDCRPPMTQGSRLNRWFHSRPTGELRRMWVERTQLTFERASLAQPLGWGGNIATEAFFRYRWQPRGLGAYNRQLQVVGWRWEERAALLVAMSNALANGVAGAGGGIIAQIVTYPLQTVNTRQQTERVARDRASSSGTQPKRSSKGTLAEIIQVIKTEGWGGLYSGLKPSLLGTAASQGIYYYFYQVFKNKAEAIAVARKKEGLGDGTVGMFSWLVVAAMAGCVNVLVTNPIWVIVTRMQTHTQAQRHILERARKVMASENNSSDLSSIYNKSSGLLQPPVHPYGTWHAVCTTCILLYVCNPSIQFMIYETSLKYLKAKRQVSSKHQFKNVTALEVKSDPTHLHHSGGVLVIFIVVLCIYL